MRQCDLPEAEKQGQREVDQDRPRVKRFSETGRGKRSPCQPLARRSPVVQGGAQCEGRGDVELGAAEDRADRSQHASYTPKRTAVEVIHPRCAGLDISKKDAKVCVRVAGAGRRKTVETVTTWGSMTSQILALREHLIDEQITCAVMEATGDCWKSAARAPGR